MKDHLPVPVRAFGFIAFLMAIAAFSALNLDNRADVSVGIHTFPAVPIYLTSLISFTLGAVLVLPFTRRRRRKTSTQSRSAAPTSSAHLEVAPEEPARKSRRRRSPKRNRRALDARD